MRLISLQTRHFRNLKTPSLQLHPRFNLLVGGNGQGKTNLLEAIHCLGHLKSFRTSRNADLITFGEEESILDGEMERRGAVRKVRVNFGLHSRKVWVNGQSIRRFSDYLGQLQVVLFAPEDVFMLKGPPADRRRFLDRAVFSSRPVYLEDLNFFNSTLKQRNALLRDERPKLDVLEVYDQQLCSYGARVIAARMEYLKVFRVFFQRAFSEIFGASLEADCLYKASWRDEPFALDQALPSVESIEETLLAALKRRRREELRRAQTLIGPHRADFVVTLEGQSVKSFASQGQHRALVLALKTSEINILRERHETEPLLLLDDVSSELDHIRSGQLFDFLQSFEGQVLISTTHRDHIPLSKDVQEWEVSNGVITPKKES